MKRETLLTLRAVAIEPSYFNLRHDKLDVAEVVSLIAAAGANCIRLGAMTHTGRTYYPSKIAPHPPGLGRRDIVEEFARECDKMGITLGLYSNAAYVEKELATHPDWIAHPYGKPLVIDQKRRKLFNLCHHSPYYDIWLDMTREIVARYQPAFYYIDCFQLMPGCSCRFCRERLRRERGYSLPRSPKSPRMNDYFRWVEHANIECAQRAFDAVRQTNAETLVLWNRGSFWGQAALFPEDVRRFSTAIGDGYNSESAVRRKNRTFLHIDEQTLIADAIGTPVFTWIEYPHMPWSHIACPPAETEIKAAKVFANGARPMMWSFPAAPLPDLRGLDGVKKVFRLAAKHMDLFDDTTLVADTSVLFSTSTSRWYSHTERPEPEKELPGFAPALDYQGEFTGQLKALLRAHVPIRVTLEEEALRDTAILLLPNTACMSRKLCERVRRFVRAGGGLLATYEASLYDENGRKRDNFGLADVFGVSFGGEGERMSFVNLGAGKGHIASYMQPNGSSNLFRGWPKDFRFPVGGRTLHVHPDKCSEVAARFLRPTRYYCDFPGKPTEWPGTVIRRFGKGTCVYLPWQMGRASEDHGLRDIDLFIASAARFVRRKAPLLETDLPDTVTVTCRRAKSGDILIHLVNLSCDSTRQVHSVHQVRDSSVILRLPGVASGRALVAARSVKTERFGRALRIKLPRIGAYEVIHLKSSGRGHAR